MKTGYLSNSYRQIIIYQIILILTAALVSGCYTAKKNSSTDIEMVVVFKIDVPIEKASSLLFEKEYIFHTGMDNSKGKKYSQETGPKYIVQVPKDKIDAFNLDMKSIPQIYEIYQADWSINKD